MSCREYEFWCHLILQTHLLHDYFYQYYQGEGSYDIALNPEYVIKIFRLCDIFKKMDASFNEETDSQAEYNAYLYQQEEFINTFQKNYQQQLITLLNLE